MLNFIFETEPIIEVQNKKILLFDFIVFFLFLFMRHEPGIWWKCGDHDAGKKQRQSAQLQISRQAILSPNPVLHPLNPKNARAGETIQFSELASGNYSVKVEAFRKTKDSAPEKR